VTQWFEEVEVGKPYPLGAHTFSAEEIVRFGKLYDPQYKRSSASASSMIRNISTSIRMRRSTRTSAASSPPAGIPSLPATG
jgi:hypothetical protein